MKEEYLAIDNIYLEGKKRDWKSIIELIDNLVSNYPDSVEVNVGVIYLLHNILLEEDYSDDEYELLSQLLKKHFRQSYEKFSNNPEYLFFIGKILFIGEWFFGLDDDLKPMEVKTAFRLQKNAFEIEPSNILYEWAYVFSKNEKKQAFELSEKILFKESNILNWLKTKGFPGSYIIESLKYCYENYMDLE